MAKICFLCVHVPLYNWKSATDIVADLTRSNTSFNIPVVEITEASKEELCTLFRDMFDMEVEDRLLDAYAEASGYCAGYFIERIVAIRNISAELVRCGSPGLTEISDELILHIPKGLVRSNKKLTVTQVRAEIAMRFSQVYDELPPVCQMMLKVLTIATRKCLYKVPQTILWEVMNDLIAKGVELDVLAVLLDEMVEIRLLKIDVVEHEDGTTEKNICIAIPALADIAMDVCTPVQIRSIANALIDRLAKVAFTDQFQVTLVVAGLYMLLGQDENMMTYLWLHAYRSFLEGSKDWSASRVSKWKEALEDQFHEAGYSPKDILGDDFCVPIRKRKNAPVHLTMLKMYSGPVALGPMGHTFSVICRNTFHELGAFHGASRESINKLRSATGSACGRYMMEMSVLEDYLSEKGFSSPPRVLEAEFDMISNLANPAQNDEQVEAKAVMILEEMIPNFLEPRLHRLYKLVRKLKESDDLPEVIMTSPTATRLAYEALQEPDKCRTDAAQDALMILATMKWKPKQVPEYLPPVHYQTVANLRTKTLKRLSEVEVVMYRHQQTVDDLEAFLIVTSLLYQASAHGVC